MMPANDCEKVHPTATMASLQMLASPPKVYCGLGKRPGPFDNMPLCEAQNGYLLVPK